MSGATGVVQTVVATDGYAFGAIGADVHVFGDGTPVYLLENWQPPPVPDPDWLRELPSRMLSARFAVVPFTGRAEEISGLSRWRDSQPRLAVRWLCGEGGSGKTRLAYRLAEQSAATSWRVIVATHGPGAVLPPPGSHDLRLTGVEGVLLIIDYADRWPYHHLSWLLSNAVLHQVGVPARVLLLGRTADAWPMLQASLSNEQADCSSQALRPFADDTAIRQDMFAAARDAFARRYDLSDPAVIPAPRSFAGRDMGLTLALNMAALVAVDAHVTGTRVPADMPGLTVYLLDREHQHWATLHGTQPSFRTPPEIINRAVFTAALVGQMSRDSGVRLLERVYRLADADQVLVDHAVCYPPEHDLPDRVLEPLYPDRLAEDFLALTIPGHPADFPAQLWAPEAATLLLGPESGEGEVRAARLSRAITFLASATDRWPHLGEQYLYPLLRKQPELPVAAGSAALGALASIDDVDFAVLALVAAKCPPRRQIDLDVGIAEIFARLTPQLVTATSDPAEQATLYGVCAERLRYAGRNAEALTAQEQALAIHRRLFEAKPGIHRSELVLALESVHGRLADTGRLDEALSVIDEALALLEGEDALDPIEFGSLLANRGSALSALGRMDEAVAVTTEAVGLFRSVTDPDVSALSMRAASLSNLSRQVLDRGLPGEALPLIEESVSIRRRLADIDAATYLPDLTMSLNGLANCLLELGRWDGGLAAAEEVVAIRRRLTGMNPAAFEGLLAGALNNLADHLGKARRHEDALPAAEEAVGIYRRLAQADPVLHLTDLAMALNTLSTRLSDVGYFERALSVVEESVQIRRRLARANPVLYLPDLAGTLSDYGARLSELGRLEDALPPTSEAVEVFRRLAEASPSAYEASLATCLHNLASYLLNLGRHLEALPAVEEAVSLRRRPAADRPAARLTDLVASLNNLAVCLPVAGRLSEAVAAAREAVEACRRLAQQDPAAHSADLVASLINLSSVLAREGNLDETHAATIEAARVLRRTSAVVSATYQRTAVGALLASGAALANAGRWEDALTATEEALAIARLLDEGDAELARAHLQLGVILWNLARLDEALPAVAQAVVSYRELVDRNPAEYLPELASALGSHSNILAADARPDRALPLAKESADLYRELAAGDPAEHLGELARALHNLGARQFELDRYEDALATAKKAVAVRREVMRTGSPTYRASLGRSLVGYASVCVRLKAELPEAFDAVQEALGLYESLLELAPEAVRPYLLPALFTLADIHEAMGNDQEALNIRQAITAPDD